MGHIFLHDGVYDPESKVCFGRDGEVPAQMFFCAFSVKNLVLRSGNGKPITTVIFEKEFHSVEVGFRL